jgi:hypothetical protein
MEGPSERDAKRNEPTTDTNANRAIRTVRTHTVIGG